MTTKVYQCIEKVNEEIVKNKEFLTELDGVIGDADHGINMVRGFFRDNETITVRPRRYRLHSK